jgi:hypothetical protein
MRSRSARLGTPGSLLAMAVIGGGTFHEEMTRALNGYRDLL